MGLRAAFLLGVASLTTGGGGTGPPPGYAGITGFGSFEEDDAAHIHYDSLWAVATPSGYYSSSGCIYTPYTNAVVTIPFWFLADAKFDLAAAKDSGLGSFTLALDGVFLATVSETGSLAGASASTPIYTSPSIPAGSHVLTATSNSVCLWDLIRFYAA